VKRCPSCEQTLPAAAFYTRGGGRLAGYCKDCQNRKRRERYAANEDLRQRAIEQARAWALANPERKREAEAAWEAAHFEQRKAARRARGRS
jgi:hypothetical protein